MIYGNGIDFLSELESFLDVGNLGIMICFMFGILVGCFFYSVVVGDESIVKCLMKCVIEFLKEMGVKIDGRVGGEFILLLVSGVLLKGIDYVLFVVSV